VKRRTLLALALAPLLPGLTRPAGAQSIHPGNWQQYLRIESESGKDKKGRDTVSGYIYNVRGQSNASVRLLIESLDAGGQPIASQIYYVDDVVPIFNRAYFEVRPKTPGASYRVSVHSGDWTRNVGGV
jgi:hypothetical protein